MKNKDTLLNSSSASQRKRLLDYFQIVSPRITVGKAREALGLMSPPARVLELRRQGYRIDLYWARECDNLGIYHRNGVYVYQGRAKNDE